MFFITLRTHCGKRGFNALTTNPFSHQLLQLRETIPREKAVAIGLVAGGFVTGIHVLLS